MKQSTLNMVADYWFIELAVRAQLLMLDSGAGAPKGPGAPHWFRMSAVGFATAMATVPPSWLWL